MTDSLFAPGRRAATLGAIALISMLAFEAIAVATAMPAVAQALDGLPLYAIAFGATLATAVLGIVLAGELCDRRGPFLAAMLGLALFWAGLIAAGFATRMDALVLGRALQGLGGGILSVAVYAGVGRLAPSHLHPQMFALFAAAWVVPALVGPALASGLVTWWGWRAVFLAVAAAVPLAAALLLPALRRLAPVVATPLAWARVGWAGLAAGGALLLHGASQGGWVWAVLGGGLAALAAQRLLPAGSLRAAPGLPAVVALRGLIAAAFASAEAFIPLLLTREHGWSLAQAGGVLSAAAVLWSVGSAVQARVPGDAGRQRLLTGGFTLAALGLAGVGAPLLLPVSMAWVIGGWALVGGGIGLAFPMLSVLTLKLAPPGQQGQAASALQLSDALTSSLALAACGLLFNRSAGAAYGPVMALALMLAIAAAALSPRAFGRAGAGPEPAGQTV